MSQKWANRNLHAFYPPSKTISPSNVLCLKKTYKNPMHQSNKSVDSSFGQCLSESNAWDSAKSTNPPPKECQKTCGFLRFVSSPKRNLDLHKLFGFLKTQNHLIKHNPLSRIWALNLLHWTFAWSLTNQLLKKKRKNGEKIPPPWQPWLTCVSLLLHLEKKR